MESRLLSTCHWAQVQDDRLRAVYTPGSPWPRLKPWTELYLTICWIAAKSFAKLDRSEKCSNEEKNGCQSKCFPKSISSHSTKKGWLASYEQFEPYAFCSIHAFLTAQARILPDTPEELKTADRESKQACNLEGNTSDENVSTKINLHAVWAAGLVSE